jgi:hypothetical protein
VPGLGYEIGEPRAPSLTIHRRDAALFGIPSGIG